MTRLLGLSGSARADSFNTKLLRAAAALAPDGVEIEVETIAGVPVYDADAESSDGIPPRVGELKDKLAAADGLLLVTPEYNAGIPGAAKNVIDWMSRPADDIPKVFGGKAVAIIGSTPGRGGTRFSQAAWLSTFRYLSCAVWSGKTLYMAQARDAFDESGELVDADVRRILGELVAGFADHCAAQRNL